MLGAALAFVRSRDEVTVRIELNGVGLAVTPPLDGSGAGAHPAAPGIALAPGGGALERGGTAKCSHGDSGRFASAMVRSGNFPAMAVDAKVLEPGAFGHPAWLRQLTRALP